MSNPSNRTKPRRSKLYFRLGVVGSAKSLNLIAVSHSYLTQGKSVVIAKPALDDRFGKSLVGSRAPLSKEATILLDENTFLDPLHFVGIDCLVVDEVQFLSPYQIDMLRSIADLGCPVLCYGLRTDFRRGLFPASRRLLELADSIEEVKTTCYFCNGKAIFNLKLIHGIGTLSGAQVELGTEEKYLPTCSTHFSLQTAHCVEPDLDSIPSAPSTAPITPAVSSDDEVSHDYYDDDDSDSDSDDDDDDDAGIDIEQLVATLRLRSQQEPITRRKDVKAIISQEKEKLQSTAPTTHYQSKKSVDAHIKTDCVSVPPPAAPVVSIVDDQVIPVENTTTPIAPSIDDTQELFSSSSSSSSLSAIPPPPSPILASTLIPPPPPLPPPPPSQQRLRLTAKEGSRLARKRVIDALLGTSSLYHDNAVAHKLSFTRIETPADNLDVSFYNSSLASSSSSSYDIPVPAPLDLPDPVMWTLASDVQVARLKLAIAIDNYASDEYVLESQQSLILALALEHIYRVASRLSLEHGHQLLLSSASSSSYLSSSSSNSSSGVSSLNIGDDSHSIEEISFVFNAITGHLTSPGDMLYPHGPQGYITAQDTQNIASSLHSSSTDSDNATITTTTTTTTTDDDDDVTYTHILDLLLPPVSDSVASDGTIIHTNIINIEPDDDEEAPPPQPVDQNNLIQPATFIQNDPPQQSKYIHPSHTLYIQGIKPSPSVESAQYPKLITIRIPVCSHPTPQMLSDAKDKALKLLDDSFVAAAKRTRQIALHIRSRLESRH